MDLLTSGLIVASGISYLGGIYLFRKNFMTIYKNWDKLDLSKYKIKKHFKTDNGYGFIIEVCVGGSFDDLVKYKGKIEKAYGCECEITDKPKSKYINVELIY